MADTTSETAQAAAPSTADAPEPTAATSAAAAPADATAPAPPPAEDAPSAPKDDAAADNAAAAPTEPPAGDKPADTKEAETAQAADGGASTTAAEASAPATNGTPANGKKSSSKRKSTASEHSKKTPSKAKGGKELHLDAQPGQLWWVRTKGYPDWPGIVCDEEMLPVSLLERRPVSAIRLDGTYRPDFEEGGKNARDRRYAVMYLGSNEFSWTLNTDLKELDIEHIRKTLEGERGKRTHALWDAYQVAAEQHDLKWFKDMLIEHERNERLRREEAIRAEAERKEKEKEKEEKKKARASKGGKDEDGDAAMDDAEGAAKKKSDKKRKKSSGDGGDDDQVPKKIKVKLNTKATDDANGDAEKKSAKKPKQAKKKDDTPAKVEEPQLTEAERREQREKKLLYLRHRLQKGFLSRDQPPKEEEMADMDSYFTQLVEMGELEPTMIRNTKINKVLKAVLKLDNIPKNDEYKFTERSTSLLADWNKALGVSMTEGSAATPTTSEPPKSALNGTSHEDALVKSEEAPTETPTADPLETTPTEPAKAEEKSEEKVGDLPEGKADVSMTDAPPAAEAAPEPAAPATTAAAEEPAAA